ncbi:GntR family transcriptional regulator [Halomonas koreensis]|uniref:GntR family transcriptional regulator n=1 Tax=Halomonas koreensis TaxID=245385 RepID=A0ABU1G0J8_9GAMM|nr:GntR family transcriptional regulator [Halomonas koreensis]MDR5866436.1 GntR family transcriptional regulator [Halomonas koreensis]
MLSLLVDRITKHLERSPRSPKYLCMRDAIIELIVEGRLPEGARLPTEQELAAALPLSLGTVQKALRDLVESGELYRQRRLGTFVAGGDHRREITTPAFGFLRPDGTRVRMVFIRLLKRERLHRQGPWSEVLGACSAGYVRLVRQDRIDGAFDCHTEIYLRADLAAPLLEVEAEALEHESVLPLLEARSRVTVDHAENRVRLVRLPKAAARVMLPERTDEPPAGIRLETLYRLADDTTVAWQIMHIPANDYRLSLRTDQR